MTGAGALFISAISKDRPELSARPIEAMKRAMFSGVQPFGVTRALADSYTLGDRKGL
ncbi:hypothetical protein ACTMTI_48535 [Nonomuraea sp. H19]|uniref:hypothetical protein n=1 Tax=Nonomuraea sp. H19 TaxID=3452206 RepID=UPI003F8AFECF